MKRGPRLLAGAIMVAGVFGSADSAQGQLSWIAPQVSYGDASDLGLGARVAFGIEQWGPRIEGHVSFDWFFPDNPDIGYLEVNANAVYRFILEGTSAVTPYAGGGFNFARSSFDLSGSPFVSNDSEIDIGLNLLGGIQIELTEISPFIEGRIELSGGEQAVLTGGVAIPVG